MTYTSVLSINFAELQLKNDQSSKAHETFIIEDKAAKLTGGIFHFVHFHPDFRKGPVGNLGIKEENAKFLTVFQEMFCTITNNR